MPAPDSNIIFVDEKKYNEIRSDQLNCSGCLSYCRFSNWSENEFLSKNKIPAPRSYCIRKTLYDISHQGNVENNLMFAGSLAYLFANDRFYAKGFIPTVEQLVERLLTGD